MDDTLQLSQASALQRKEIAYQFRDARKYQRGVVIGVFARQASRRVQNAVAIEEEKRGLADWVAMHRVAVFEVFLFPPSQERPISQVKRWSRVAAHGSRLTPRALPLRARPRSARIPLQRPGTCDHLVAPSTECNENLFLLPGIRFRHFADALWGPLRSSCDSLVRGPAAAAVAGINHRLERRCARELCQRDVSGLSLRRLRPRLFLSPVGAPR